MILSKRSRVDSKILKRKGDNFEIGRDLGMFWGNYFSKLDKRIKLYRNYKKWLQDDEIDERRGKLLTNMVQHFPALFHELVGMNIGINESEIGFKASLFGLFTCWLAETDLSFEEYNGCSSVLLPIKNGFYLAHSDEYDEPYPLVVADVSLKTADNTFQFISISHPFQLLGSVAGMNRNFAFQGNSIGCSKVIFEKIQNTWHERIIPKTVFTRMMLEKSSIAEIKTLYQNYASTLPNHHYVVFSDMAYSIEVKPSAEIELIVQDPQGDQPHIHTNHFLKDPSYEWEYTDEGKESRERWNILNKKMAGVKSPEQIKRKFKKYLKEYIQDGEKLIDRTSGAFFFTIQQGKPLSCECELNYHGTPRFSISTN